MRKGLQRYPAEVRSLAKHGKKECSDKRNSFFADVLRAEARGSISEKPARAPK